MPANHHAPQKKKKHCCSIARCYYVWDQKECCKNTLQTCWYILSRLLLYNEYSMLECITDKFIPRTRGSYHVYLCTAKKDSTIMKWTPKYMKLGRLIWCLNILNILEMEKSCVLWIQQRRISQFGLRLHIWYVVRVMGYCLVEGSSCVFRGYVIVEYTIYTP